MSLALSSIDSTIRNTLQTRETLVNVDRSGWFSNKTPWIRFTSMASVNGDSNIRKKWILYGGTSYDKNGDRLRYGFVEMYNISNSNFKNDSQGTYEKGDSILNRPVPGVTEITIQNKGSWGALRESVIHFVCWDRKQLSILEKLFMTPGISCLLEWGWSSDVKSNKYVYKNLSETVLSDEEMAKKISDEVRNSGGHYDALQGPISDFSWNLRDDGGYDCTTTIVSRAAMLLAMNIHGKAGNVISKVMDDEEDESTNEDIKGRLENIARELEYTKTVSSNDKEVLGQLLKVHGHFKTDEDDLETVNKGKGVFRRSGNFIKAGTKTLVNKNDVESRIELYKKDINDYNQGYITWGCLEDLINDSLSLYSKKEKKRVVQLETDKEKDGIEYGWINYRTNLMSADPYVCVLPDAKLQFGKTYVKKVKKDGTPVTKNISKKFIYSKIYNDIDPQLKEGFFKGSEQKIKLSKILVNIRFIYSAYVNSELLSEFLTTLLNGISEACGNMWDFQLMNDEEDPTKIYVIDTKTITVPEIKPYQFKVYSKNSIVKNVSLNTEVSEQLKVLMMYGASRSEDSESEEVGNESTYGYRLYRDNVYDLANGKISPSANTERSNTSAVGNDTDKNRRHDPLSNLYLCLTKVTDKRTEATSDRAKIALNRYIIETTQDNGSVSSDNSYVVLPLKLELTIDGISGVRFGNAIDIDYKPERYSKYTYFQTTNVSHTINKDTWDTTFETVMRVDMNSLEGVKPYTGVGSLEYGKETQEISNQIFNDYVLNSNDNKDWAFYKER